MIGTQRVGRTRFPGERPGHVFGAPAQLLLPVVVLDDPPHCRPPAVEVVWIDEMRPAADRLGDVPRPSKRGRLRRRPSSPAAAGRNPRKTMGKSTPAPRCTAPACVRPPRSRGAARHVPWPRRRGTRPRRPSSSPSRRPAAADSASARRIGQRAVGAQQRQHVLARLDRAEIEQISRRQFAKRLQRELAT